MQSNFADHVLQTLSWTFIHSLWLGLILSVVAGSVMLLTTRSAASLRYALLTGSYFLFLLALIICFSIEWNSFEGEAVKVIGAAGDNTGVFRQQWIQQVLNEITVFLKVNSFGIVAVWIIVIFFKAAKMLLDLLYVSRMRSRQLYSPGEEWTLRLQQLRESIGITQKVSLAESALVKVPLVIGHLKPLILMPVGILSNLSVAEVEAVLLHELAHIRRHDYLVNFIQRISETLLFFNPALLWVSSLMRIEREHCCDDIAIAKTANPLQFAEALISFKEYSMKPQHYALGLFGKKSLLLQRMTRIVYKRNKALSPFEVLFFTINLVLFCLLVLGKGRQEQRNEMADAARTFYIESSSTASMGDIHRIKVSSGAEKRKMTEKEKAAPVNEPVKNRKEQQHEIIDDEKPEPDERMAIEQKMITEAVFTEQVQYSNDILQHELQRSQAERDREQAEMNRKQAEKDRAQAGEDRARADVDRINAAKDRERAEKDRLLADKDRAKAEKDRQQAEKDRVLAEIRRKKADEERKQYASVSE